MADEETVTFGTKGGAKSEGSTRDSRSVTRSIDALDQNVVSFLLAAVDHEGGDAEFAAFTEDGVEVNEATREAYDLPEEFTHICLEGFYGDDIESDYIGNTPRISKDTYDALVEEGAIEEGTLSSDDFGKAGYANDPRWEDEDIARHVTNHMMKAVNGHHYEAVWDAFGEGVQLKFGIGKGSRHDTREERMKTVRVYTSDSEKAPLRVARARKEVGDMTQSEFEEWCVENGYEDEV